MSSTTAAAVERQTYWCHECDMSVSLISSSSSSSATSATATATAITSSSLLCPHCHSDFLEEMDSPHLFNPNPNPNPSLSSFLDPPFPNLSPHQSPPTTTTTTTTTITTAPDDNYLLDSPYLHRLIQHLTNSESDNPSPTTTTTAATRYHSPAAKSAVESIPTIKITAAFLDLDPINLCAVCKDQFVIDVEAKQLPCKHMYHSDCILPWLAQHNSCPVCRFQLPTESDESKDRRRSRFAAVRFREFMMEDEDLFGFESTLRHIARRHRVVFPDWRESIMEESLLSPTQVGEAEAGVERSNSVETVSSWPSWPMEGGINVAGDDGVVGVSARMNEDGDIIMS